MTLTRKIERGLSDGETIVVEREWQVQFARQGSGAAITGRQSSAKVTAPATLAKLAEIEQARSTDGMFPILLTDRGTLASMGASLVEQDFARAVEEAKRAISARQIATEQKEEQIRYLALIQKSAGRLIERMPPDLFFPAVPRVQKVEPVSLGDGRTGEFELIYETKCALDRPWLEHSERLIITRFGSSEQQSREIWTMAPA